ncbi:MAG: hypothetical protein JNK49_12995 [Planctomycetes bacterium]|nr:hypothetical protein [Planctomycetota bacterium]
MKLQLVLKVSGALLVAALAGASSMLLYLRQEQSSAVSLGGSDPHGFELLCRDWVSTDRTVRFEQVRAQILLGREERLRQVSFLVYVDVDDDGWYSRGDKLVQAGSVEAPDGACRLDLGSFEVVDAGTIIDAATGRPPHGYLRWQIDVRKVNADEPWSIARDTGVRRLQ